MYSIEYMADGELFAMSILATDEEIKTHANNLNGTYEILTSIHTMPEGFEYVYHGTSH